MSMATASLWAEQVAREQLAGVLVASSLLCLIGLIWARMAANRSAAYRSWIWQLVGATIVVAAGVLVISPGVPMRIQSRESKAAEVQPTPQQSVRALADQPNQPMQSTDPVASPTRHQRVASQPAAIGENEERAKAFSWVSKSNAMSVLVVLWIVGGIAHFILLVLGISKALLIARCPTSNTPPMASQALDSAHRRIGFQPVWPLRLNVSNYVASPMTIGIVIPSIVLPECCSEWERPKLETVLAHELAHIQRKDNLWQWIMRLACCVAWFNPLVWLAARRAIFERERACDDRVLLAGVSRKDYARTLVEVAASMSRRHGTLASTISMAEPPIQSRVKAILADSPSRVPVPFRTKLGIAGLFLACAAVLGTFRPLMAERPTPPETPRVSNEVTERRASQATPLDESIAEHSSTETNEQLIALPKSVEGSVTDLDGAPIAGAEAVIQLAQYLPSNVNGQIRKRPIHEWTVETDAEGRYSFDPSGAGKVDGKCRLNPIRVRAENFAQEHGRYAPTVAEVAKGKPIGATKLRFAQPITGRLVTANGEPTSAIIRGTGVDHDPNNSWWLSGIEVDDSGRFRIFVPLDMEVELVFYAAGHAPKYVALEPQQRDLGPIQMELGTVVEGVLLNDVREPVSGAVVTLDNKHDFEIHVVSGAHFAVLTDDEGNFRFPPCSGECKIAAANYSRRSNGIGSGYIEGVAPPAVVPQSVTLDVPGGKKRISLQAAPTKSISGTIRWESGQPAEGLNVWANGQGTTLDTTTTDAEGRYRLQLPIPLNDVHVMVLGAKDKDGRWHRAHGVAPSPARSNWQFISLDRFEDDFDVADWQLRLVERKQPESDAEMRARHEFDKLRKKEESFRQAYFKARETAKTQAAQQHVDQELGPSTIMSREYLAFERKHRGSSMAFQALNKILSAAATTNDPNTILAKSREVAVERLIRRYLQHEDLPQTFGSLGNAPPPEWASDLLRQAILKSPHKEVRSAALLQRANQMLESIQLKENFPAGRNLTPQSRAIEEHFARLRNVDVDATRQQIQSDLEFLATEYADVAHKRAGTYGNVAKYYRSASRLEPGAPVPPLRATDLNGRSFELHSLRGKTVVVTFCYAMEQSQFTSSTTQQRPYWDPLTNQNVAAKFKDKGVEFVTVVWAQEPELFKTEFDRNGVIGTIIPQTSTDSEARMSWGVTNHPTTLLVDTDGTLVGRQHRPLLRDRPVALIDGNPIPASPSQLLLKLEQMVK